MTRTEEDLLGTREVPEDAYWGIHTLRAIENYQISGRTINEAPELIRAFAQVKKACAMANMQLKAMKPSKAEAIIAACDEIIENGRCMDQFPVDQFQGGAGTSVNMNANEVIANLALEILGEEKGRYDIINPNDHVNRSQSTNDAYPTAFRIALWRKVNRLRKAIDELADAFDEKGAEFRHILTMGRTQLQDAVPMSLGSEFSAFAHTLREEDERLVNNAELLLETNLGATAIGTGLNTPDGYQQVVVRHLRRITGARVVGSPNLLEATSDTGAYVSMHATIKRSAVKLSKVCNDLRLLASGPRAGLNEINLPKMAAGSSIMQPVIAQALIESINLLVNACDTLRERCITGITANEDVCRGYVENSIGIVTYFNDVIGHHLGDVVGKRAAAEGKTVREVIHDMELLSEEEVERILSPENLAHPKYAGTEEE